MLLKDYIAQKRAGLLHGGRISRRTQKKMRRRLSKARLGYYVGEGALKRFMPLNKAEHEVFLQMMRNGSSMEELETTQGQVEIDEESFGHFGSANHKRKGFQWWHKPYLKRPGLLNEWWAKGVRIKIRAKPYAKMVHWCQAVDTECSGLGKTIEHKDETGKITMIEVVDVMLFDQECSSGYTELSEEALQKFLYELAKNNENPGNWKLWWHTHYNFSVFWSGVDDANVERLIKTFGSYLVSTVINQNCDILGRIDEMQGNKEFSADNEVSVVPIRNNNLKAKCVKQAKKLVRKKVYAPVTYAYPFGGYTDEGAFEGFSKDDSNRLNSGNRSLIPSMRMAALGHIKTNADLRRAGLPQDPDLADYLIGYGEVNRHSGSEHGVALPFFID